MKKVYTDIAIIGAAVMDRVRSERDRFVGFVVDGVESIPESQRIRGYASFVSDHVLQVDDHTTLILTQTHSRQSVIYSSSESSDIPG